MYEFLIKVSTGKEFCLNSKNMMTAQAETLKELKNEGDYLEITTSFNMIQRTTKKEDSNHPNHKGFVFSGYDYSDRHLVKSSLFH
tara:strand:+ start:207 stop:461 length:255 start_codon:yes stop_codon:yes gene_type:complete